MWPQAEAVIIKALRHEPANKSNYLLWSNLGLVRQHQENFDGAIESFTIGLSSAPKSTVLLTNRARAFLAKGMNEAALADINSALQSDSTLKWPLKMKGLILANQGNREQALVILKEYDQKFSNDRDVDEVIADILSSYGDFQHASEYYRKANKQEASADTFLKLALSAYSVGKLEDVEEDLREGISKFPQNGDLYLLRALLNKSRYQTNAYESDLHIAKNLGVNEELYKTLIGK